MNHYSVPKVYNSQAAVLCRRGEVLVIESLEMEPPRDDDVLVRIVASGICRTDIDFCDDWYREPDPLVLDHEGAGVVEVETILLNYPKELIYDRTSGISHDGHE